MALTRIFITVKTYPTLSEKYDELVCTAGFKEDGTMIRLYPVPFRKLESYLQYKKYQWIEIDIKKRNKDFRPESFSPVNIDVGFTNLSYIDSKHWDERRDIILSRKVYTNMEELILEAKNPNIQTSLAVVKPSQILDFYWIDDDRSWCQNKIDAIKARSAQYNLFENRGNGTFKVVQKIPYKFKYRFTTEDGVERNMMIEDWEIGMLYLNCLKSSNGNEQVACNKVKDKYFHYMVDQRELYFFVGTSISYHNVGPNPFMIIGTFYPPKTDAVQLKMF